MTQTPQPKSSSRSSSLRAFGSTVLLTSVVLTGLLLIWRSQRGLEDLELNAYDRFVRMGPDEGVDDRLLVVGIGETDIQSLGQYPIEDGTLATALENLESYNPRVIGLDLGRDVPQGPPEGRERLLQILGSSDRIVSACLMSSFDEPGVPAAPTVPEDLIGFADWPQDLGGVIRRSILISTPAPPPPEWPGEIHLCNDAVEENQLWSFSFLSAVIYLESDDFFPDETEAGDIVLGSVVLPPLTETFGGYARTGAVDYQLMLNYRSALNSVERVTLSEVLQDQVDPDLIEDRVVLIGNTSTVAKDLLATPYIAGGTDTRNMPGVVVHAQAVSQLLSAVLDGRPLIWAWPEVVEILWIWGWSILGGAIAFYSRRMGWLLLLSGISVAACWGIAYALFLQGGWIPLPPAALALVITAVGVSFLNQANRQGYTLAIYEQLKEQLRRDQTTTSVRASASRADYLEDLVKKARAVRLKREGLDPDEVEAADAAPARAPSALSSIGTAPGGDVDALRQDIEAQVRQDLELEAEVQEQEKKRQLMAEKEKRLQALLNKAKTVRDHHE